jgi:murein DD-endopeptidase MepM/ murein hydrolase activator NlpD
MRVRIGEVLLLLALLAACALPPAAVPTPIPTSTPPLSPTPSPTPDYDATPLPTREPFAVGHKLPYVTQTGDTIAAIAAHFNTTGDEILALNPGLSPTRTLASGLALTIPAYWFPLGGTAHKMIPDSELVYGPTTTHFDLDAYLAAQPGYLSGMSAFVAERQRTAAQAVLYYARQYSINPRLLLALMEWRTGALTRSDVPDEVRRNPFGPIPRVTGFVSQLRHVSEQLSLGYYGWRTGRLITLRLRDSTTSRPDFYQSAGSVALQYLFAQWMGLEEFNLATGPQGFASTYIGLWGNPFDGPPIDVIPGDLEQPELTLPFEARQTWSFTGGPHPVWGDFSPWAALDFAPAGVTGCAYTDKWVTAAASGVVVRAGDNTLVLDLDGDAFEQTGWVLFHFHLTNDSLPPAGTVVAAGDPLGHPSCDGGQATGTHVHIARKYNGEWIPADGILPGIVPFNLGGWVAQSTGTPYQGRMMRLGAWVEACTCSTAQNTVYWVK